MITHFEILKYIINKCNVFLMLHYQKTE